MTLRNRNGRRATALVALVVGGVGVLGLANVSAATIGPAPHAAKPRAASSAQTVNGRGRFSGLAVTVSQTQHLVNQVVQVSWTGGAPTYPSVGGFNYNFLQIMQCWGPDTGPAREDCEFGGHPGDGAGAHVSDRQLNQGNVVDPNETIKPAGPNENAYDPFIAVDGTRTSGQAADNQFFDGSSSNEINLARTRADGTGQEFFEVQTSAQSPGLGCGDPSAGPSGTRVGRSCWLVVVPRDDQEVDGSTVSGNDNLSSSPLSASNWANHIQVPLGFEPLGLDCPLGSPERRTYGHEVIAEAVVRWQPALCKGTGTVYGYSELSDSLVRQQLASGLVPFAFVSRPLTSDQTTLLGHPVTYAPLALSSAVIAFNIERQSPAKASDAVRARDGTRIPTMNLTPRVVAKLLTQSYQSGDLPGRDYLANNPATLASDPDFLQDNPDYKGLSGRVSVGDIIEPLGQSDDINQLWQWVTADKDARAWLDGSPDPWGAVVNPSYKGITLPRDDFPKSDLSCIPNLVVDGGPPWCTLDFRPYASDEHGSASAASHGLTLQRNYDRNATPPSYKQGGAQSSGSRNVIAFTDASTAARFNLPTARLRNAAGDFVGPGDAANLASFTAMRTDASGMLLPDPTTTTPGAYPLTTLSYAAYAPAALDTDAVKQYGQLLKYVAGDGQVRGSEPGQLPDGYTPLPQGLRAVTAADAAALDAAATAAPSASPSAKPTSRRPSTRPATTPRTSAVAPATAAATPAITAPPASLSGTALPAAPVAPVVAPAPSTSGQPTSGPLRTTASTPVSGVGRNAVLVLLVVGGLAVGSGPTVLAIARRRATRP